MNKTSRGKYLEKKAEKQLKEQGYWVEKAKRVRFQPVDFWGCWDLIAINQKEIRFIQVSDVKFYNRSRKEKELLLAFPRPPYTSKEYWHYEKVGKKFKVQKL